LQVLSATRTRRANGLLVRRRGVGHSIVEICTDSRAGEDIQHSTDVIAVVVACDQQIDGIDVKGLKVWRDGRGAACVNENGLAGLADERSVALSDVKEADFELLGGELRCEQPERKTQKSQAHPPF
jgi:hypothetical protein